MISREELVPVLKKYQDEGVIVPSIDMIRTPEQLEGIRKACALNNLVLDEVSKIMAEGITTQQIDDVVKNVTESHGGICAPYHFEGFPKHVCTSINAEVCHGIPSRRIRLKKGDIVNVDVSTIVDGYYGDASRMFVIGETTHQRRRLIEITRECLNAGIAAAQPYARLGDIGAAIEAVAKANGVTIVEELGGHGCGIEFHEDPFVAHYGVAGTGMLLVPGMTFTIEPMINAGKRQVYVDAMNGWTVYTRDGSDSAQIEHMILITETGNEILSA